MNSKTAVFMVSALSIALLLSGESFAEKKGKPGSGSSMVERHRPGPPSEFHAGGGRGPGPEGHRPGFQGFGGPGMHGGFINHPEVQKRLGLTEEQVEKLQSNRRELEKRRIKTEADIEIARIEMEELLKGKEIDKAAINKHVDALGDLHKQQIRGMVDNILAVHEILDGTQLEKVQGFMDRVRGHRGGDPFGPSWRGDRDGRGRDHFRSERRGGPEGPPDDGSRRRNRSKGDKDKRHEGPPPHREGRAPSWAPDRGPSGFGQAPFGPPPVLPPPRPDDAMANDDFADLGPALDYFLNAEE